MISIKLKNSNVWSSAIWTLFIISLLAVICYTCNKFTRYTYLGELIREETKVIEIGENHELRQYDNVITFKDNNGDIQKKYDIEYKKVRDKHGKLLVYQDRSYLEPLICMSFIIFCIAAVIRIFIAISGNASNPFKLYLWILAIPINLILLPIEYCKKNKKS